MAHRLASLLLSLACCLAATATATRHWTVADGLPTGEIRQIIELPNGQMLVNCEGAFCLSDGRGFTVLPCERNRTFRLDGYTRGYAHLWQGDSLLWLRDFYRVYAFDTHIRAFRYDLGERLEEDDRLARLANGQLTVAPWTEYLWHFVLANGLAEVGTCATADRQGGIWVGTRSDGIHYFAPPRHRARVIADSTGLYNQTRQLTDSLGRKWLCRSDGLLCTEADGRKTLYHSGNVEGMRHVQMNFIAELPDHRLLLCYTLHELGYFDPERRTFSSLTARLPELGRYRYFVGACPIDERWTAIYTQNGAFLLDTREDTLASLPQAETIENASDKYNCMLRDRQGCLWVGTQNGLFVIRGESASQEGSVSSCPLSPAPSHSSCIRSLVADRQGNVWAGTSCGISRITPSVVNLGADDGVPSVSMNERAACLMPDGRLAFAHGGDVIVFHPDSIVQPTAQSEGMAVVLTSLLVNEQPMPLPDIDGPHLRFSHDRNHLTFRFSALNYATPSHTRYRHRLLGVESDWHTPVDASSGLCTVDYRALPPGRYTFEAQAAIGDGPWGPALRQAIVIRPPLWLTWWAKALYLVMLLSALSYAIHLYLRRRRAKLERENEQRVNHLFELREEARHQFAENVSIDAAKIAVNTEEQQLVRDMLRAIESHMADADYGVDQLAQDVCMSRSALYARLRTMLGITPSDFIRNVRLKHAARLLADTQRPINEIADLVGYNTHKAFAANFKKIFGCLPSEYREGRKQA